MSLIINAVLNVLIYLWGLLKLWLSTLFITPFQNPEMLWILLPIWIGWFLAEFFQEKKGTSMGNAISNAVIVGWGSIDWIRQTISFIEERALTGFWNIVVRFSMAALVFGYGTLIVVLGLKGKEVIKYIGRVREVTYVFAMFTPVFYQVIPFSLDHLIATALFFPAFYFAIEFINQKTPDSKSIMKEMQAAPGNRNPTSNYSQPSRPLGLPQNHSRPIAQQPNYPRPVGPSQNYSRPMGHPPNH